MAERRRDALLLRETRPPVAAGIAAAITGVALATGVVFALREAAPVLSLGVVYLFVVLVISVYWGLWLGIATALASALASNFFHIPPPGRFTIADTQNWVRPVRFLAMAAAASAVAEMARDRAVEAQQRREEADLSAAAARALLGGANLEHGLAETADRIAAAAGLPSARLALGRATPEPGGAAYPLRHDELVLGTLVLPAEPAPAVDARLRDRIVPALEALLAAALEREALSAGLVETAALRRSDHVKTAILRAVSHDLRSPLTAIMAAGEALSAPALEPADRLTLSHAVTDQGARLSRLIDKLLDLS